MTKPNPLDAVFAAIVAASGKPKPATCKRCGNPLDLKGHCTASACLRSRENAMPVASKTDKPRKPAAMTPAELRVLMKDAQMEPVHLWRPLGITDRSLRFYLNGERRISKPVAIAIRRLCAQARKKRRTS